MSKEKIFDTCPNCSESMSEEEIVDKSCWNCDTSLIDNFDYVEQFKEYMKEMFETKESSIKFLEKVGILENGILSKKYSNE